MSEGLVMICDVDLRESDASRIHTVEVARAFALEGLAVDLLTRGTDPHIPGVRHTSALGSDHQRFRRLLSLNVLTVRLLWTRRHRARRLYVRYGWTVTLALVLGRLLRYRIVTQVDDIPYGRGHEQAISPLADYFKRACAILMGQLIDGVVAVTPQIKDLLVDQFHAPAARIAVLPNGVDVEEFTPIDRDAAIERLGLDSHDRHIVFCGHFAPWVDFNTILDGYALVAAERKDARLVLVGDGGERGTVEHRIRELGLSERVIITGFVSDRAVVRDYIAAAVVAITANRLEHRRRIGVSPVKLAEYLAAGRAVVATDLPGLRETIEATGAGRVVDVSPTAFARAIIDLLEPSRADEVGARGRAVAERRFSWRLIARQTLGLFGSGADSPPR